MKIHALTLTWNGQDKIERLMPTLAHNSAVVEGVKDGKATTDDKIVWHIRDNGSKDDTINFINTSELSSNMAHRIEIRAYDIGHNRDSFATGVNYLFAQANPSDDDLVLLLNNDVVFNDHHSVKKMIELQKRTGADVVGARLLYTNTDNLQHAGVIFGKRYGDMPYHFRPGEKTDENSKKNRYFQACTAAVQLVNPKAFREVGGMDEKFKWAFEDIDLCLKIGQLKKNNIVYCGGTNIYHDESASLKKNPVNKMFIGPNASYFKKKWFGKYELDHEKYLNNPGYNEVKV